MAMSRDARLLDWARRGDGAAFERLHARHQAAVLSFCRHLTGSWEDAEDAVQHTFLAAYRRITEGEETPDWQPWLFTVARNRCLTLLRARRGESLLADPELAATVDGLAVEVERREELRDIVRDMARLPEPQRAALVLSQLDALSYREIGTVLGVTPEKVKALVFQARSSLASAREARDAPCVEIRQEIATARGSALRRRLLRRHVGQCDGCREFEVAMLRQRDDLSILLPVAPSVGLGQAILGALDRETAASGGAATVAGGATAGLGGTLAAIGLPGVAKLAVVAAVVGGGASGALAADLPARIGDAVPWRGGDSGVVHGDLRSDRVAAEPPVRPRPGSDPVSSPEPRDGERPGAGPGADDGGHPGLDTPAAERAADGDDEQAPSGDGGGPGAANEEDSDLPPGLAKRDELPPGLAKRDELPPGLARQGAAPGQGNGQGNGAAGGNGQGQGQGNGNGQGVGNGNGQGSSGNPGPSGVGNGNANGNSGAGQGQGQGNAGGAGQGNGNGQGNGQGQGNSGGQGNGGQGNGNGNGNGNPH